MHAHSSVYTTCTLPGSSLYTEVKTTAATVLSKVSPPHSWAPHQFTSHLKEKLINSTFDLWLHLPPTNVAVRLSQECGPREETQMSQAGRMGCRVRTVGSRGGEEPESQAPRECWGGRRTTHWEDRAGRALKATASDPTNDTGAGLDPGQASCPRVPITYCEVPEPWLLGTQRPLVLQAQPHLFFFCVTGLPDSSGHTQSSFRAAPS